MTVSGAAAQIGVLETSIADHLLPLWRGRAPRAHHAPRLVRVPEPAIRMWTWSLVAGLCWK